MEQIGAQEQAAAVIVNYLQRRIVPPNSLCVIRRLDTMGTVCIGSRKADFVIVFKVDFTV